MISTTTIVAVVTVLCTLYAWKRPDIQEKWMMNPYRTDQRKEYYRFLTSGLIHADYMHLIFNMIAFYSFGQQMEATFKAIFGPVAGIGIYLALYVLGIVVSDIPTFLKHRSQPHYNSLGASGGVSAVVFAYILFNPMQRLGLLFIPIPLPAFVFGGLYMAYSYFMARRGGDYVNHDAHLWGALFGIVFSIAVFPPVVELFTGQIMNR